MFWIKHRVLILFLVYIAFFGHAALWHHWGIKAVGHLGFGEFFSTLMTGIVTSGTIFTLLVFVHATLFGGWFCGWLCHWGITQDFVAWVFKKCKIKPKMIQLDKKLVPWVWFLVLIGQVIISWICFGFPNSISFDYSVNPVWYMVPRSILLICMTTIVSGFLLVYLFGERAFCRSICTFKIWFGWFEKIAPHKVRQINECDNCKSCTQACPMGIMVADEIQTLGYVKNSECIKCYKCVGACPSNALKTSFKKTSYHKNASLPIPTGALNYSTSLIQASLSIVFLSFFGYSVGGNMSCSLAFITGFALVRFLKQRSLSLFEFLITLLLITGLYYSIDMNDATSLIKGLAAIGIFILLIKKIGYKSAEDFLNSEPQAYKPPLPLVIIFVLIGLLFSFYTIKASYLTSKTKAAALSGDFSATSELLESSAHGFKDQAMAHYTLAMSQLASEKYDDALENFIKSLEINFSAESAQGILDTLYEYGDEVSWLKLIDHIIEKHPEHPEFLISKAEIFMQNALIKDAEQFVNKYISIKPDSALGYIALSGFKMEENLDEAKEILEKAYQISPQETAKHKAALHVFANEFAAAEKYFFEAIKQEPQDLDLYLEQGVNYARQEKFEQAITAWNQALKIKPDFEAAINNIGIAKQALTAKRLGH